MEERGLKETFQPTSLVVVAARFPVINDVDMRLSMSGYDDDLFCSIDMRLQLASAKMNNGKLEAECIVEQPQQEYGFRLFKTSHSVRCSRLWKFDGSTAFFFENKHGGVSFFLEFCSLSVRDNNILEL
ncbi:hypothetical protein Tco_0925763 [Tanacetum coccineum]|uniref:Uncharacterized protein n=1 Tax=Tanacetum coccineum TaxID=301880 RepID=A0ABQ5D8U9_9ASTR